MSHHQEDRMLLEDLAANPFGTRILINMPYCAWERKPTYLKEAIFESVKIFRMILSLREEINSLESQCMALDFTKLKKPIIDKLNTKIGERKGLENDMNKLVHPYHWSAEGVEMNKYILYLEQEH